MADRDDMIADLATVMGVLARHGVSPLLDSERVLDNGRAQAAWARLKPALGITHPYVPLHRIEGYLRDALAPESRLLPGGEVMQHPTPERITMERA